MQCAPNNKTQASQTWYPVIYFILVLIVGSYVVLNLFIAVIIDGFLQSQEIMREKILQRNASLKSSKSSQSADDSSSQISEDEDTPIDFKKWAEAKLNYLEVNVKIHRRVTDLPSFANKSVSLFIFRCDNAFRVATAFFITSPVVEVRLFFFELLGFLGR